MSINEKDSPKHEAAHFENAPPHPDGPHHQKRPGNSRKGSHRSVPHDPNEEAALNLISSANAKLANPLRGISREQLMRDVDAFAQEHELTDIIPELQKGALIAQDPAAFESIDLLTDDDKRYLREEITHKWRQPKMLYYMVVMSSLAAAVQGMDEAVINGAQILYPTQFGIANSPNKIGLVNSAPYLCCAVLGCWLTDPLNKALGRKKTIFLTCAISFLTCLWSSFTNTWWHLFIARFFLGLGIGPKSATVPVYSAECSPAAIRGALVMMWQMWTAFGIALGDLIDVAFYFIPDRPGARGLNWRLMLGSAGIPALLVCMQVLFAPESPRWLIGRGRYPAAFTELTRLRRSRVQAARDLYYIHVLLLAENEVKQGRNRLREMFTVRRNRNAMLASGIVMFGQQFCGVNVIAYYSSTVFVQAGLGQVPALLSSFGFGALNFLFALPAVFTIDTFGRRNLLLFTFPWMAVCLLITGFSFWAKGKGLVAGVSVGIYLFAMFYSPGEGPVPFTYSAEAFPLYVRDIGMSYATAVTWFFNFVLSISFPPLLASFGPQGAFGFYAGWCIVLWWLILLFVPETKGKTLEELDQVFAVPARAHAAYGLRQIPYGFRRWVLRRDVVAEDLYGDDESVSGSGSASATGVEGKGGEKGEVQHRERVADRV